MSYVVMVAPVLALALMHGLQKLETWTLEDQAKPLRGPAGAKRAMPKPHGILDDLAADPKPAPDEGSKPLR
jgi:hypothetical protein